MIDVDDGVALPDATRERVAGWIERMVAAASLTEDLAEDLDASFRLVGDAAMTELNRSYRETDGPTDVLAFAQREGAAGDLFPHVLGDVVISVDTAARQATGSLEDELLVLAAHGLCHLLGYDHQNEAQDLEMKARMAALMAVARAGGPVAPA